MKALYVGAGTDTLPYELLTDIKDFVHIDSQPFSEFDVKQSEIIMDDGYSPPDFLTSLTDNYATKKLEPIYDDNNKIIYVNKDRAITYFTNTSIPNNINIVFQDIKDVDTLIVRGHDPHSMIMDIIEKPITFIGFSSTSYANYNDDDTVIKQLHTNQTIRDKFNKFIFYDEHNHKHTFNTWEEFIKN